MARVEEQRVSPTLRAQCPPTGEADAGLRVRVIEDRQGLLLLQVLRDEAHLFVCTLDLLRHAQVVPSKVHHIVR